MLTSPADDMMSDTTTQQRFDNMGVTLPELIDCAIESLRFYEAAALEHDCNNGYWGCFSGGKDSVVIKELTRLSGVKVVWHYNVTTIDPPELCRFIRKHHPDVTWNRPPRHFFKVLAEERGYPLRQQRWCCQEFKESKGRNKVKIMGVRRAESPRRKDQWKLWMRWDATRSHGKTEESSWCLNPIYLWRDEDVWQFIRKYSLPYCELYDQGMKRLGCIGCPMSGAAGVKRDFARWPQYERAWRRAFHRLWKRRYGTPITRGKRRGQLWPGMPGIETPDQLFERWQSGLKAPDDSDDCQLGLW